MQVHSREKYMADYDAVLLRDDRQDDPVVRAQALDLLSLLVLLECRHLDFVDGIMVGRGFRPYRQHFVSGWPHYPTMLPGTSRLGRTYIMIGMSAKISTAALIPNDQ